MKRHRRGVRGIRTLRDGCGYVHKAAAVMCDSPRRAKPARLHPTLARHFKTEMVNAKLTKCEIERARGVRVNVARALQRNPFQSAVATFVRSHG